MPRVHLAVCLSFALFFCCDSHSRLGANISDHLLFVSVVQLILACFFLLSPPVVVLLSLVAPFASPTLGVRVFMLLVDGT